MRFILVLFVLFTHLSLGAGNPIVPLENFGVELLKERPSPEQEFYQVPEKTFISNYTDFFDNPKEVELSDFEGNWVLLYFWSSDCQPCKKDLSALQKQYEDLKEERENFEIVPVSLEDEQSLSKLKRIRDELRLEGLPLYFDDLGAFNELKAPKNKPFSVIINPSGKIVAQIKGKKDWGSSQARSMFDFFLGRE